MIKVENIKVFNFEGALRGLRNPLESWDRSDSLYFPITEEESDFYNLDDFFADVYQDEVDYEELMQYYLKEGFNGSSDVVNLIGPKDLKLAQRMIGAGTDESKFMRQIFISMDITAPLFWQTFCQ